MSLAEAIFRLDYERQKCEDVIYWSLSAAFRNHSAARELEPELKRLDWHDNSIEWWAEPGAVLDELDVETLRLFGFHRAWVCYRGKSDAPRAEQETYYHFAPQPLRARAAGGA